MFWIILIVVCLVIVAMDSGYAVTKGFFHVEPEVDRLLRLAAEGKCFSCDGRGSHSIYSADSDDYDFYVPPIGKESCSVCGGTGKSDWASKPPRPGSPHASSVRMARAKVKDALLKMGRFVTADEYVKSQDAAAAKWRAKEAERLEAEQAEWDEQFAVSTVVHEQAKWDDLGVTGWKWMLAAILLGFGAAMLYAVLRS